MPHHAPGLWRWVSIRRAIRRFVACPPGFRNRGAPLAPAATGYGARVAPPPRYRPPPTPHTSPFERAACRLATPPRRFLDCAPVRHRPGHIAAGGGGPGTQPRAASSARASTVRRRWPRSAASRASARCGRWFDWQVLVLRLFQLRFAFEARGPTARRENPGPGQPPATPPRRLASQAWCRQCVGSGAVGGRRSRRSSDGHPVRHRDSESVGLLEERLVAALLEALQRGGGKFRRNALP